MFLVFCHQINQMNLIIFFCQQMTQIARILVFVQFYEYSFQSFQPFQLPIRPIRPIRPNPSHSPQSVKSDVKHISAVNPQPPMAVSVRHPKCRPMRRERQARLLQQLRLHA